MSIQLENLTKSYGRGTDAVRVLDGINLTVERGEISAIVGPSGAGKSTLSKCINLQEQPTSGRVLVNGTDLATLRGEDLRHARRSIGTIFQGSSLLRRRTAAQNIALPLEYLGVNEDETYARVRELLERVGLSNRANHFPGQLSGGQRQRIGIARALALRPYVLLADEATSGLDPEATSSILSLLQELRDDLQLSILLITHEMDVVREVADTVSRLDHGSLIESGKVSQVVRDQGSELSKNLVPLRPFSPVSDGLVIWNAQYTGANVPADWLFNFGRSLDVAPQLLSATVENVGGISAGRVAVGLPDTLASAEVITAFAQYGLSAQIVGTGSATRSIDLDSELDGLAELVTVAEGTPA